MANKSSSQRRFEKLVAELRELVAASPSEFRRVWAIHLHSWIADVHRHARAQRMEAASAPIPGIFSVLERATRLARALDMQSNKFVAQSLVSLEHECASSVATVTDPNLYRFRSSLYGSLRH